MLHFLAYLYHVDKFTRIDRHFARNSTFDSMYVRTEILDKKLISIFVGTFKETKQQILWWKHML